MNTRMEFRSPKTPTQEAAEKAPADSTSQSSHCNHRLCQEEGYSYRQRGKKPSGTQICSPQAMDIFKFLCHKHNNLLRGPFLFSFTCQASNLFPAASPQASASLTSSSGSILSEAQLGLTQRDAKKAVFGVCPCTDPMPSPSAMHLPQLLESSSSPCLTRG